MSSTASSAGNLRGWCGNSWGHVVITRGSILKGLDQMYIQVAQASFYYLLFGGMIEAVFGGVVGMKIFKGNSKEAGE